MNILNRQSLLIITILSFCVIGIAFANPTLDATDQGLQDVITFSHQFHIEDIGADCTTCHSGVEESAIANDNNMPKMDDCFACHDDDTASQDCGLCHSNADEAVEYPNVERETNFNHQAHIPMFADEDIPCAKCHSGVELSEEAGGRHLPDMNVCADCHNDTEAPQFCETCHTQLPTLRPQSHNSQWIHQHDSVARAGNDDCSVCHTVDYCQECHDGAQLSVIDGTKGEMITPFNVQNWGIKNLTLTKNHDLNYKFTHAVDARSKLDDCALCHDNETFCASCHEEVFGIGTGKPASHNAPNWGAIAFGIGTGGGEHAKLAKRDISNCAACHDSNGEDPVCLMCHIDRVPGKNNDLKTHSDKRYRNTYGPWHGDDSYTCFTCHINTGSNPTSFCGYCHTIR